MIKRIVKEFRSNASWAVHNEVELFRCLASAIQKFSRSTFIDETHGGKVCNVEFDSVLNTTEVCEISDLLIMSISRTNEIRATFWQAKKEKKSRWLFRNSLTTCLDFTGQFNQWDLLARRPTIRPAYGFNPPHDLLSAFDSASIGSFGVFYEHKQNIEVAHSVAEMVTCAKPAKTSLAINSYLHKYNYHHSEAIGCLTLDGFLHALFAFRIGALIDSRQTAHAWLISRVLSKAKASGTSAAFIRALSAALISDRATSNGDEPEFNVSILIVREENQ